MECFFLFFVTLYDAIFNFCGFLFWQCFFGLFPRSIENLSHASFRKTCVKEFKFKIIKMIEYEEHYVQILI